MRFGLRDQHHLYIPLRLLGIIVLKSSLLLSFGTFLGGVLKYPTVAFVLLDMIK